MRELAVRIRFTKDCLGNVKKYVIDSNTGQKWPVFLFPRTPDGAVRFEANWFKASIRFAAEVLCRHHKAVEKIHFDIAIVSDYPPEHNFYKRFFDSRRYVKHEAFRPGDVITVNCVVPSEISDEDFKSLMELVGRFKGVSPYGPREYGFFTVEAVTKRIGLAHEDTDKQGGADFENPAPTRSGTAVADECATVHPPPRPNHKV